jgi:hypothetical protein
VPSRPQHCDLVAAGSLCLANGEKVLLPDAVPKGMNGRWSFDDNRGLDSSGKRNHAKNAISYHKLRSTVLYLSHRPGRRPNTRLTACTAKVPFVRGFCRNSVSRARIRVRCVTIKQMLFTGLWHALSQSLLTVSGKHVSRQVSCTALRNALVAVLHND